MRHVVALVLAMLIAGSIPLPSALADLPRCGAGWGEQPTLVPMTGDSGACADTMTAGVDDVVRHSWPVWRGWDLRVTIELLDVGIVDITRRATSGIVEEVSATGPTTVVMENDVPLPLLSSSDMHIYEQIELVLAAGGSMRYTLHVQRVPPPDLDCGQPDSSPAAPIVLASGVTCTGIFVDGWREGGQIDRSPPRPSDGYVVRDVTDGDLVRLDWTARGHSMSLATYEDGDYVDSMGARPPLGQPATHARTLVKNGDGEVRYDVQITYPDVQTRLECGELGCWTRVIAILDFNSGGPHGYDLRASIVRNDRPTLDVTVPPPPVLFDGDRFTMRMRVSDPDGGLVSPAVSVGTWSAPDGTPVQVGPDNGPSGTDFVVVVGPLAGAGTRFVTLDARDALGVGLASPSRPRIDVHPADCGAGRGDAPPAGRAFVGSCTGFVHPTDDPEDVLLYRATPGARTTLSLAGLGATITTPDGGTTIVSAGGSFTDIPASSGDYVVRVEAPSTISWGVAYEVKAHVALVSPPSGAIEAAFASSAVVTDSDLSPDRDVWLQRGPSSDYVKQVFHVDSALRAAATTARIGVLARAGACGDIAFQLNSAGPTGHSATVPVCSTWPTTHADWGFVTVPVSKLRDGTNTFQLTLSAQGSAAQQLMLALDETYPTDATTLRIGGLDVAGRLVWKLEATGAGANPDGSIPRGAHALLQIRNDRADGADTRATLEWSDGAITSFDAPWRASVATARAFHEEGAHVVRIETVPLGGSARVDAEATAVVRLPNDCAGLGDAPAEGVPMDASCKAHHAHDDPEDVLVYTSQAGRHLVFTVAHADATVVGPDGLTRTLQDGRAHAHAAEAGEWRVQATARAGLAGDAPYWVNVTEAPANAPSGAVHASPPSLWPTLAALDLAARAEAPDHEDLAFLVDWGDGVIERVPSTGFLPSGSALGATHAYAAAGAHVVRVDAVSRVGTALAPFETTIQIVAGGDCGAGDAPGTNDGHAPLVSEDGCWGDLVGADALDMYQIHAYPGESFELRACALAPLVVDARLYVAAPQSLYGVNVQQLVEKRVEGGCVVIAPAGGTAASTSYLARIERVSGAGAYELRLARGPPVARDHQDPDDAHYSWNGTDEGWRKENERVNSDVGWDAASSRVELVSERADAVDEVFSRSFARDLTGATTFRVEAKWRAITQGAGQRAFPIFLADAGVRDAENAPNFLGVVYESGGANPQYRLRYRDAAGVLRVDQAVPATHAVQYGFLLEHDAATGTLRIALLAQNGATISSASYVTGAARGDGFVFGKVAIASDGWGGSAATDAVGYVDDVRVRVTRQ